MLHSLTLVFRKKLPPRYGFALELDLRHDFGGQTPAEQRAALKAAVENEKLLEFVYRADDDTERHYWVDVLSATGMEETGVDERGVTRVQLAEP